MAEGRLILEDELDKIIEKWQNCCITSKQKTTLKIYTLSSWLIHRYMQKGLFRQLNCTPQL